MIFIEYARDPEVTRYLTWLPHENVDRTRAFLQRCLDVWDRQKEYPLVIDSKASKRVVGMIGMRVDGHRVNLGYVLARPYWGKGLMTEAARAVVDWALSQPEIHRVWAVCDVENAASARVLEKAGLEREGTLRRLLVHPNRSPTPRDCFCYSTVK